jgi:uncharacterized RDD family membrane protein YckC
MNAARNSHEEPETGTPATGRPARGRVALRTLARLLVGSALVGWDALTAALQPESEASEGEAPAEGDTPPVPPLAGVRDSEADDRAREALVGMLFDISERAARQGGAVLGAAGRRTHALTGPATRWARRSKLLAPARRRYVAFLEQSQVQVERWVERGRAEEVQSRALLETTVVQAVDTSLDRVIENPKVQELIEEQSTGVAQEVVEELRERAVSMDMLVQQLVGRVLRRPPRRLQAPLVAIPIPARKAAGAPLSLAGQPAGFVSRLVAFVIDVVVISVAFVATNWLFDAVQSVLGAGIMLGRIRITLPEFAYGGLQVSGTTLFWVGYLLLFWTTSGRTVGKAVLGLRVVTRDGQRLSLGRSLLRVAGYVLSAIVFYLGFLWAIIDGRQRAWHDHLAGTYVVYCWDAHPEERFLAEERRDLEREGAADA